MEKHYFAVDAFGWATDEDLDTAVLKRIEDSGRLVFLQVWEIPLPETAKYKIKMYAPMVVGAKMIKKYEPIEVDEAKQVVITEEKVNG